MKRNNFLNAGRSDKGFFEGDVTPVDIMIGLGLIGLTIIGLLL